MLVICYLFCVCVCRLKAQQSLCLYVVLTMPTLNKAYLFIYLLTFVVSKMAVSVSVANKNKADIRDGNEYKIPKWLVLKFHGSGHLPNHTTSK